MGESEYVRVDSMVAKLADVPAEELREYLTAHRELGSDVLGKLLRWAVETENLPTLLQRLGTLGADNLRRLNAAVGLERLKQALSAWDGNQQNGSEEFWQRTLADNAFLFEHVFAWPTTIMKGKAYVGGKGIDNADGKLVDFLIKNSLTHNVALLEIKTPMTKLLGAKYREGVYNTSTELSGSVVQVLDYKSSLLAEWNNLVASSTASGTSFEPKCVVIIGTCSQLTDGKMRKSLELFRSNLSGVVVLCFDELFEKTRSLISLLEQANAEANVP